MNQCTPSAPAARTPWSDDSAKAEQTLFREVIGKRDITLTCVREKIKGDPVLSHEDPKRVYDKVRAEWRYKAQGCH